MFVAAGFCCAIVRIDGTRVFVELLLIAFAKTVAIGKFF